MKNDNKLFKVIYDFRNNHLSESEHQKVANDLKHDADLQYENALYDLIGEAVVEEEGRKLKEALKASLKEKNGVMLVKNKNMPYLFRRLIVVAASIALVVYFSFAYQYSNATLAKNAMQLNFIEEVSVYGSASASPKSYYEKGDFDKAIAAFKKIQATEEVIITRDHFYAAMSLLKKHQITAANKELQIIAEKNQPYTVPSKYYLALIALNNNDKVSAQSLLKEVLANPDSSYEQVTKNANNLLNKLAYQKWLVFPF